MDYRNNFFIPGIDFMSFPEYAISKSGKIVNFKAIVYPNPRSAKKYTRKKQLSFRSQQAKLFDFLINIGYFNPFTVIREMPIIIKNSQRIEGLDKGLFFLCDYYIPEVKLAIELDSEYHSEEKDKIRDKFLKEAYGIDTFRIRDLQKESVQKGKFHELTKLLKSLIPNPNPIPLNFTSDLYQYLEKKGL